MDTATFRQHAHALVDWMADYLQEVEHYPVRAQVNPGEIQAQLPTTPPQNGEAMADIFADFQQIIMPGITHWQHPSFFAYFPANSSPPSILAEMLTATLGAQCMLWQTSPAASELEHVVLDWLRQMLGLPDQFQGVIQDSATSATLVALITARERASQWQSNQHGVNQSRQPLAVYCSQEAHSSIEKGCKIAGLGTAYLRKIAVDEAFALDAASLKASIEADLAQGIKPICVVACLGTTSVGACDPLLAIGQLCQTHGIWLHIDAAWAGSAMILPEYQPLLHQGIDYADSFVFNPHKWLLTNFDCSAYFVRDTQALEQSLALVPAYLKTLQNHSSPVTDYQNWSLPLGRRFRALKLWFVLRSYGVTGLQNLLREHVKLAQSIYDKVQAHDAFEMITPLNFTLFTFRFRPRGIDDEDQLQRINHNLVNQINASGKLYVTQTSVQGTFAIRFMVGQTYTTQRHVDQAWDTIVALTDALARQTL